MAVIQHQGAAGLSCPGGLRNLLRREDDRRGRRVGGPSRGYTMDLSTEESGPLGVRAVEAVFAEDLDRLDQAAGDLLGDGLGVAGADEQVVMDIPDAVDQRRLLRLG